MEELSATQIGARLGVSERTAQRWIRSGRLRATLQANGYYLVDPADIDALRVPTLPTSSASALADILNRLERLEQQVDPLSETVKRLEAKFESQPSQIPTTAKQSLSASQETQERTLKRERLSTTTEARQPIPARLPEGTVHVSDFATEHGVNRRTLLGQIREHDLEHIALPSNRAGEYKRYLTPTQQRAVLAFWQRNGTPHIECPDCPH